MCEIGYLRKKLSNFVAEETVLKESFQRLNSQLKAELKIIHSSKAEDLIPSADFDEVKTGVPTELAKAVRKRGVLLVRQLIPSDEATRIKEDILDYMTSNGEVEDPKRVFREIYWAPAQVRARQHPNVVSIQHALNGLWRLDPQLDSAVDLTRPMMYVDRVRVRPPGHTLYKGTLRMHWDNGSLSRWTDRLYREHYDKIFSGRWEEHDPFLVAGRAAADSTEVGFTFFRTFQGWTALSPSGPGDGTLRLLPLITEPLANVLLRPLVDTEIDEHEQLPGYQQRSLFYPDEEWHGDLKEAMITLPQVEPGDAVFWHPDILHSVEKKHNGDKNNIVIYIPTGPDCPLNRLHAERIKYAVSKGLSPPDFYVDETHERRYVNRASWADWTREGKNMVLKD